MIVGARKLLIDARLIYLEKSLEWFPEVGRWDPGARPDRMNESRAANLEPLEPARLECRNNAAGEPNATRLEAS